MNISPNWRDRRLVTPPLYYSYASYGTDAKNMNKAFSEDMIFNDLHLSPDHPLRKNLADVIVSPENMALNSSKRHLETQNMRYEDTNVNVDVTPLSGITNFLSGVVNVISNAMFSKLRPAIFSSNSEQSMALPPMWHDAKDENKDLQTENLLDDIGSEIFVPEMSDCKSAAAHCQSKLDEVRSLLCPEKPKAFSFKRKRPKKVFVEPNSVEDNFVDAFSPEDFESLVCESYYEYLSPVCHQNYLFQEVDSPKVKVEPAMTPTVDNAPVVITESAQDSSKSFSETQTVATEIPNTVCDNTKQNSEKTEYNQLPNMANDDSSNPETTKIMNQVPELNPPSHDEVDNKKTLVDSCENKMMKLKLLLQERREKCRKSKVVQPVENEYAEPVPDPEPQPLPKLPPRSSPSTKVKETSVKHSKRYHDKRRKCRMRKSIEDDLLFADEISVDELSSSLDSSASKKSMKKLARINKKLEKKPVEPKIVPEKDYFDEVSGRFPSTSAESDDDSFQVVFHDGPRERRSSDCESEDSFIVFEESPDSCYTSNDVFGDDSDSTDLEDDCSDSDDSDDYHSTCSGFKLNGSLSRSVCNLADDSLYTDHSGDEVDFGKIEDLGYSESELDDDAEVSKGLLIDRRKKWLRRNLPPKKVHFSPDPPKVHVMRVWLHAAQQARCQYWELFAVDRLRFKHRVQNFEGAFSWMFRPPHRTRVMFQRFMPFWNAQKRKELAEKKEREAQEMLKEEERLKNEKIEMQNAELRDKDNLNDENDVANKENDVPTEEIAKTELHKNDHEENENEVSDPNEGNSGNLNEENENADTCKPNEESR